MSLRLCQPLSLVINIVPTLLRQLRRSLQIKKITNATCVLEFTTQPKQIISISKKGWLLPLAYRKKKLQKLHRKRSNNWPVTSFIKNEREIRIYSVSSANKLEKVQLASLCFKTQIIKPKAKFLRTSFLKLQINRLVQGHSLTEIAIFIATHMKKKNKKILSSSFY